jgi:hypothetical protein
MAAETRIGAFDTNTSGKSFSIARMTSWPNLLALKLPMADGACTP